ncbi:hypothetical protein [Streptomyces phytophilus]|uniref:hypothetical protein n=1 Tax=Streptomyces phytophilus TaxID=722715 RepID=UPI0015F0352C|nr:hypothetical protein [Streptomyces phytophilus]
MSPASPILVCHSAGSAHDDLARQVARIASEVAPVVEDATALRLPPGVEVHLVTRRGWIRRMRKYAERIVREDAAAYGADRAALKWLNRRFKADKTSWLDIASTLHTEHGPAQVLLCPPGLKHAGFYHHLPRLVGVIARELCQVAQHHASSDTLLGAVNTSMASRRGLADRALRPVVQGHARWCAEKVLAERFGEHPTGGLTKPPSRRHARRARSAGCRQERRDNDAGNRFVTHVLTGAGQRPALDVGQFDVLFSAFTLMPSPAELAAPDTWLDRVQPVWDRHHSAR